MRRRSLGQAYTKTQIQQMITAAANQYGVPSSLALAVAQTESSFNPNAISGAGAVGVMQLMPATASGLGVDPNNVQQNIDGGVKLLSQLLDQYDGDVTQALWAYNAGPGSVASGSMPAETAAYIPNVLAAEANFGGALPAGSSLTGSGATSSSVTGSSVLSSTVSFTGLQVPTYALVGGGILLFVGLWIALD